MYTHQLLPQAPTLRKMENKQTTSVLMLPVGDQSHQLQRLVMEKVLVTNGWLVEKRFPHNLLLAVLTNINWNICTDEVLQRPRLVLSLGGWAWGVCTFADSRGRLTCPADHAQPSQLHCVSTLYLLCPCVTFLHCAPAVCTCVAPAVCSLMCIYVWKLTCNLCDSVHTAALTLAITLTPVSQAAESHIPHICLRRYVPPSVTLSHFHSALQTFFDV